MDNEEVAAFEFWFDFSCPYAYLAWTQVEALAQRTGASVDLRPMLLGGVFRALDVPDKLFASLPEAKARHNAQDLQRYAALTGVGLRIPPGHPLRTVEALRALLVVGPPWEKLIDRFYKAYWVENLDIGKPEVLMSLLGDLGYDGADVLRKTRDSKVKEALRQQTDEALAKGVFGAPAFVVDGALFWGRDRIDMVEAALGGTPAPLVSDSMEFIHPVDVFFDYSSPFSRVGVALAERIFGDYARYRPMLLGGLYRAMGTPDVPLFLMNDSKRAFMHVDLERQAERAGLSMSWPSRFPMNTILALRMTLAAGAGSTAEGRRLMHRIFAAYWDEDRDISEAAVLADFTPDGAELLERTSDPAIKEALREETEAARALGVFGAPAFVVRPEGREPALFWGADRIELAARAAAGDERLL